MSSESAGSLWEPRLKPRSNSGVRTSNAAKAIAQDVTSSGTASGISTNTATPAITDPRLATRCVSTAKPSQSSVWRWMPAKAKIGRPGTDAQRWRFAPAGPDQTAKLVAGIRQRSSGWRSVPIQNGLVRLRTVATGCVPCGGGGTPQSFGRR